MKIQSANAQNRNLLQKQNPSFKAGKLNILATSDNHGNLLTLPQVEKTIHSNKLQIFSESNKPSTLNIFAVAGDFFINPSKRGFLTKKNSTNGEIQAGFLSRLINSVKTACGLKSNFDTVYALGNHCLDGGDKFIMNTLHKQPLTTLVTNVNLEKSPTVTSLMEQENSNIVKSKIYEIEDDKNPNLKHHALFLGVTIPSMDFYNPGLLKGMEFYDNSNKKDSYLKEENLTKTFECVDQQVKEFKEKYPKGAVILLSHTGNPISKLIRKHVPNINIILNGHDHLTSSYHEGKSAIYSLGKDNEILRSLSLNFNDKGDLESISENSYFPLRVDMKDGEVSPMKNFLKENFEKDLEPIVSLSDVSGEIDSLNYSDGIRYSNSYLANYLTSALKRSVKKIHPSIDSVAIQSSIIRGPIKNGANNLDLMKIFDGVSEDLATVKVGKVSADELSGLITENVLANLDSPTRNTLIQWSDFQIDRTLMEQIKNGSSDKDYMDAIKFKDPISREFIPLDKNKNYEILLPDKYLLKNDIKYPSIIRNKFQPLNGTYDSFFKQYLDEIDYDIRVTAKTKEKRIL